jgi:hypothetical protein
MVMLCAAPRRLLPLGAVHQVAQDAGKATLSLCDVFLGDAMAQHPPLTLIFHSKDPAPVRGTGQDSDSNHTYQTGLDNPQLHRTCMLAYRKLMLKGVWRRTAWLSGHSRSLALLLFNTSQLIAALIAIFTTSAGAAVITFVLHSPVALPIATFSGGLLFGSLMLFTVYLRAASARGVLLGYRWVSADYTYTISAENPCDHQQDVTVEIEAVRPKVTSFENRFMWTGQGEAVIEINDTGHSLGGQYQYAGWTYYSVNLGRELAIGERVRVSITQLLYDKESVFEPFLAKTLNEPIAELSLHVNLPEPPLNAVRAEYSGAPPASDVVRRNKIDSPGKMLEWHIQSPILRHRYEIRWQPLKTRKVT